MVEPKPDAETDSDLLWAAIAGLRADVERLTGRLERIATAAGPNRGEDDAEAAEEAARVWFEARQKQIDRLMADRSKVGKGEDLDDEDREQLKDAWLCG